MRKLDNLTINGTALRAVTIVNVLRSIAKNKAEIFSPEAVAKANSVISKWKLLVRSQEHSISNCSGGNVANVPHSMTDLFPPDHLSVPLWNRLSANYNVSQLFAIKYVAEVFDSQQDTRIALIQGMGYNSVAFTITCLN
jgi:hypothetical protein